MQYTLTLTVNPTEATVADIPGLTLTPDGNVPGKYTATVEYQQEFDVVSTLTGYDQKTTAVTIGAENKIVEIQLDKSTVSLL